MIPTVRVRLQLCCLTRQFPLYAGSERGNFPRESVLKGLGGIVAQREGKPIPTTSDVGSRVTIRIHDEEPGKFRDLLGYLVDPTHVKDKRGVIKSFDPEKIVLWKIVEK